MSCEIEQIADCGDISSLGRALFIPEREETNWLSQCCVSLSSCGGLLAVGYKNRLCLLNTQWISSTDSNTYLITWSGTLPSDITVLLALPICPSQQSSQNGPDWFCIIVGFKNGSVGFYTNTGHLLLMEKLEDKPVMKISCHTGVYGTLPDDIIILFQNCECIVTGASLFQMLKNAKARLARVQAGILDDYTVDSRNINIRKWVFSEQDTINDAEVVGLELKNTYDHLLAASTYGGYDTWYRSVPPVNSLIIGVGIKPYVGFHYALEGGTTPPLQDVARAVANKIKSALPGWLGGSTTENTVPNNEPLVRSESLSMRNGLYDTQRQGSGVIISPDRRLAALTDSFGRVAVLDIKRGHLIRLFKGCRDAQCGFIQIFDADHKKPQLSVVKEIKRALFLIIYNPKKGLIDIRLMQRGNRIAVFTATKNGQLIYNTCGLVGAEKNYTHKKLNLPEFQCVLLDPDGKLKRFNIPFFYALDGEHSQRSKDLHTLRELREYIKKTSTDSEDYQDEVMKKVEEIKTLDLKKHCLEMLIRNHETPSIVVTSCLNYFWNSMSEDDISSQGQEIKNYFANIGLLILFYRQINNEDTEDMQELALQINDYLNPNENKQCEDDKEVPTPRFQLLEDDNCILEKLLHLAQQSYYKEHQHAKVKFADSTKGTFKEFVSCFVLDGKSKYISLKSDTATEKLNNLASTIFNAVFKINDLQRLGDFVKRSNFDPREIVKLVIMHLMNMPLDDINLELIERVISVLYYLSSVSEEAKIIPYNEVSLWWESIREMLVDMPCPLRSMVVAMVCKAVARIFEMSHSDDDAWESVTKENAKWGILIGKLEDISILSIVLVFKDNFCGSSLPKLQFDEFNINLKYIYSRGKGSVTELIAKWLCSMGVPPEAVIANELIEKQTTPDDDSTDSDEEDSTTYVFLENNRKYVDENPNIFKWFSLLCRQFPLSTSSNYIIANMCWEYAKAWQNNMQKSAELKAIITCLVNISDLHLRLGLFSIIWSTYFKTVFEATCRLVNKVGRLPKDPLCLQDLGFNNTCMLNFLEFTTEYLNNYFNCSTISYKGDKQAINYEKIWDESMPSLVEVAQGNKNVNNDILNLNYQISCTVFYQCHFNLKFSKPLDSLYDIDYQYIFDALTENVVNREISLKASEKLRNPRLKFITKLIRAAIDTIASAGGDGPFTRYDDKEFLLWVEKISVLSDLWNIDMDFLRRQQVIGLYHLGFDTLAENIVGLLKEPEVVLPPLLAISIQRLKRSLEHSNNQREWIVTVTPNLYKHLQTTALDTSIPAQPSLATTSAVLQKMLIQIDKQSDNPENIQNIKLAKLIIENCEVLIKCKL